MKRKSYDAIDLAKWICSFCIVYIHAKPFQITHPALDAFLAQGLFRLAVPLFFVLSAFFLFKAMNGSNDKKKIIDYFVRILLLYVSWSLVYTSYRAFYSWYNGLQQESILQYLHRFFLKGEQIHLWYLMATLYAIPVVYLLRKAGDTILIAVCVTGNLIQCVDQFFRWGPIEDLSVFIFLREDFAALYYAMVRAIPMMCLGILCLRKHEKCTSRQWLVRLIIPLSVLVVEIFLWRIAMGKRHAVDTLIMAPPVVYYLANLLLTVRFSMPAKWIGKALRYSSTWIYCIHMLVMALYAWIFAYEGLFMYVAVAAGSLLSGIPYVAVKIVIEQRKKR